MKRLHLTRLLLFITALFVANHVAADESSQVIGDHRVYYSAFNSSFIQADIAASYQIARGKNRGIVNISAVPIDNSDGGGRPALVKGSVANMFGQTQVLKFMEIREGDVVYYLAPFKFNNEDSVTFSITIKPDPNKDSQTFSFQNKFYYDD